MQREGTDGGEHCGVARDPSLMINTNCNTTVCIYTGLCKDVDAPQCRPRADELYTVAVTFFSAHVQQLVNADI